MKHLILILSTLLISACCTSKNPEANLEVSEEKQVAEVKIPLPPKPPKLEKVNNIDSENPEAFNHSRWNKLVQKNVSEAGNVNYANFKNNPLELAVYIDSLGENTPTESWTNEDKLAYWINAYNALTVDLIIRNYPIKSIKNIKNPWKQSLWQLGDKWYNLDEIEHQILRKMNEPRIHFAIVCASFSCPKLQNEAFTASKLEAQLTKATKEFLADKNRNEISKDSVKISKIFQWFTKDFKQNGSVIDFLNLYTEVKIAPKAKISYKDYSWDLNE